MKKIVTFLVVNRLYGIKYKLPEYLAVWLVTIVKVNIHYLGGLLSIEYSKLPI